MRGARAAMRGAGWIGIPSSSTLPCFVGDLIDGAVRSAAGQAVADLVPAGDAAAAHAGLVLETVLAHELFDVEVRSEEALHLVGLEGERWPLHLCLGVLEGHEQPAGAGWQETRELRDVAGAIGCGEGDGGGAIPETDRRRATRGRGELRGRERGELRGREGEEIALDEGEVGCLVDRAVGKGAAAGGDAALGEELLDREGGDLDADDGMASLAQPLKVQALAAQGHEDGRVR